MVKATLENEPAGKTFLPCSRATFENIEGAVVQSGHIQIATSNSLWPEPGRCAQNWT